MRIYSILLILFLIMAIIPATHAQTVDTDSDGIPDSQDACPYTTARGHIPQGNAFYGCVDLDFDSVADVVDDCPTIYGEPGLYGCPPENDRDGDGIFNNLDACPDTAARGAIPRQTTYYGCVDIDFDTIADAVDACPLVAGKPEFNGCLDSADRDGDGILNDQDACAEVPAGGTIQPGNPYYGCADGDGDGIADHIDACPQMVGVVDFNGCLSQSESTTTQKNAAASVVVSSARASLPTNPGSSCFVMPNQANRFVNVRKAPGQAEALLRTIPDTTYYRVIGRGQESAGGVWYQLEQGGWVAQWVVDSVGACEALPLVNAVQETDQPLPAPQPVEAVTGLPQNRLALTAANASSIAPIFDLTFSGDVIILMNAGGLVVQSAEGIQRYNLTTLTPESPIGIQGRLLAMHESQIVTRTPDNSRLLLNGETAWAVAAQQAILNQQVIVAQSADNPAVLNFLRTDASGQDQAVAYPGTIDRFVLNTDGTLVFLNHDSQNQYFLNVVDLRDPAVLLRTIPTQAVNSPVLALEAGRLALGTADGQLQLWEQWTLTNAVRLWDGVAVQAVAFGADMIAVGSADGQIAILDSGGTLLMTLTEHNGAVQQLMFSPDGTMLLSVQESTLQVWGVVR